VTSLQAAKNCLVRLDLEPAEQEAVLFLIGRPPRHVCGPAARRLRSANRAGVREKMGTPERLKMLCLMTYADIKSVNRKR